MTARLVDFVFQVAQGVFARRNVCREQKLMEKLDYMHRNPVQRGLVTRPEDWTWSSARHYASQGAVNRLAANYGWQ